MDDLTAQAKSKRPRGPISGPYGHPFHPMLVTVPIGTWIAALVFDVIGLFVDDPGTFALGAQLLVAIGIIGALTAAVLGLVDLSGIASGTRARRTGLTHMALNLVAVALFAVNFFVRVAAGHDDISIIGMVLTIVGLGIVGASGWLGGKLAFRYGVRVADEQTQAEGFR